MLGSLFGVIGNGIAMSLDQCEEAEGCAPNVSEEELAALIAQIEGRIAEIERRIASGSIDSEEGQRLLAGFRQELANFETYKQQLAEYNEAQDDFGDDFGELDEFAEEFDEVLPEPDVEAPEPEQFVPPVIQPRETPVFAAPEPEPELEPAEEAFEELDDEFIEEEIPADEFEDLDEGLEELVPKDEFEELDDEFQEITLKIESELLLGLIQPGHVNQYRGAIDVERGQVVWTGDIVLPASARSY